LYKFEYAISGNESGDGLKLTSQWLQHSSNLNISSDNEITDIEGVKVSDLSHEEYCDFLKNKLPLYKKQDTISMVLLNDGKDEKITLNNKKLLPK
jgi:hypothetical protein